MMMAKAGPGKKGRTTNWFAIWTSVIVVVVLIGIGVLVVFMNTASSGGGGSEKPTASNINTDTGAISFGTGTSTVDTYIDFMCPVCQNFESIYGATLQQAATDGEITLRIHPISILDRLDSAGTEYSTRAASAMYCVAVNDPDKALAFMQKMYTDKPAENTPGLTNAAIATIAEGVGATKSSSCIKAEKYTGYVTTMTPKTPVQPGQQSIATPTIVLNGKTVLDNQTQLTGDPQKDILDRLKE